MDKAKQKLAVYGQSAGSYVAIKFSADVNPRTLILDCPFSSIHETFITRLFPRYLHRFLYFLLSYKLDNLANIGKVKSPTLFIHAKNDKVCPSFCSNELYHSSVAHKKVIYYHGVHINPEYPHALYSEVKSFIDSIPTN